MLDLQAVRRFMVKQNETSETRSMGDWDASEADALSRLEAALDRIAQLNQRPTPDPAATPAVDAHAIASRLDKLIGQLRHALAVEA